MRLRAMAIWLVLVVVAFANGFLRETVLIPRLGSDAARLVSPLLLCGGIAVVAYIAIVWIRPLRVRDSILIGIDWTLMTLAFEFGFGRLTGNSWAELFAEYDVSKGRVWILVLIATALAPYVTARMRRSIPPGDLL